MYIFNIQKNKTIETICSTQFVHFVFPANTVFRSLHSPTSKQVQEDNSMYVTDKHA